MELEEAVKHAKRIMEGYEGFWCVAGGWAIDLYLDRRTRANEDLEIVVLREEHERLHRHFLAHHPRKIVSGEPLRLIMASDYA